MQNKYLENNLKKDCNGCGICSMVCPVHAIDMIEDDEGFLYPKINEEKCIKCNKCKKFCSHFNPNNSYIGKTYAGYTKIDKDLKEASSGGIFYILAKYVISKNGVVFGVSFNENLVAQHEFAENLEDCKKFRGSKYVRSNLNGSFEKVKEFLNDGRIVLFTGTPCQCNALKVYLGKEYNNLITCDVICHANPSPKVLKKYIEELEKNKNKKVKNVYFRSKENGWRNQTPIIEYIDGEKEEENTYFKAFVRELLGRPSCHNCHFASPYRITEFTIGDLWGKEKFKLDIDNGDNGLSLFTVNNDKADKIFSEVNKELNLKEIDGELAFSNNHYKNELPHRNRERFYSKIDQKKSIIKWMRKNSNDPIAKRIKNKTKRIIKKLLSKKSFDKNNQ